MPSNRANRRRRKGHTRISPSHAALLGDLHESAAELSHTLDMILHIWSQMIDQRSREPGVHTQRVTELTLRLAAAMGVTGNELVRIRRGALLHDVGMMLIPEAIVLKPGALTDDEWEIIRKHPEHAYELLKPIGFLRPALDIPYCHHEKWDGTGYPRGLKQDQIPLAARIFSVADVWVSLRSARPYRQAWPEEKALLYMREQAYAHFDSRVVETFLKLIGTQTKSRAFRTSRT